ncbi:hypothetical protein [Azotobacter vinelandii]|uniref:hypothetical protein n=1 Tax=Azotobacter vinelandii TaxID=354 RepID=UPI000772F809|nr:hypothetical protein [Azotobacter vinelandii]
MIRFLPLPIPADAFAELDLPEVAGPLGVGDHTHRLWLCRVFLVAAIVMLGEARKPEALTPDQVLAQVGDIQGIDRLYIDYAERRLPSIDVQAWAQIAQIVAGFTEQSIPLRYKGRDKRVPALKLYAASAPVRDLDPVFTQLQALAEMDPVLYQTLVVSLRQEAGDCEKIALAALREARERTSPGLTREDRA